MNTQNAEALDPRLLPDVAQAVANALGLDLTEITDGRPEEWAGEVLVASFRGASAGRVALGIDSALVEQFLDPTAAPTVVGAILIALGLPVDDVDVDAFEVAAADGIALSAIHHAEGPAVLLGVMLAPQQDAAHEPQSFEPTALPGAQWPGSGADVGSLSLLNDVDMEVTVELGRTRLPIRELLALQPGMVVEIDRAAGAPVDVLVNGRLIACGEVVVIDDEFGLRITEIVSIEKAS